MVKSRIVVVFFLVLVLLTACSGQKSAVEAQIPTEGNINSNNTGEQVTGAVMDLTTQNDGETVIVKYGDTLRVHLEGNPTTGYTWEAENLNANLLEMLGEPEFKSSSNLKGAGGDRVRNYCFALKPVSER